MNKLFQDLAGKKYGKLTALYLVRNRYWMCVCDCGKETIVYASNLKKESGTKSCGCFRAKNFKDKWTTHGKSKSSEYGIWKNMLTRCNNPKKTSYHVYGGRGISVCDRWKEPKLGFINFYEDLGARPSKDHSLERINVNGNYEPSNCKWVLDSEQSHNRNITIKVWRKNEIIPLAIALKEIGVDRRNFHRKMKSKNWSNQEAFNYYTIPKTKLVSHSFGYII